MFDHPGFRKYGFEEVPIDQDIFIMDIRWAAEHEGAWRLGGQEVARSLRKDKGEWSSGAAEGEGKMSQPNMLDPTPELPDDTLITNVRFSTRVRNALKAAGLKTVGEVREASDATLLSLQDLGQGSVAHLRGTLGLPSCDGVRPG